MTQAEASATERAARPRQALALSMLHWQQATDSPSIIAADSTFAKAVQAAVGNSSPSWLSSVTDMLHLAHLVSKPAVEVEPTDEGNVDLIRQKWAEVTWPTGDIQLLQTAMLTAAEVRLRQLSQGHLAAAVTDSSSQEQGHNDSSSQAPYGRQLLASANDLICRLVRIQQVPMGLGIGGAHKAESRADSAPQQQLHPAVVNSLAARACQLSPDSSTLAEAVVAASVLTDSIVAQHHSNNGSTAMADGSEDVQDASQDLLTGPGLDVPTDAVWRCAELLIHDAAQGYAATYL